MGAARHENGTYFSFCFPCLSSACISFACFPFEMLPVLLASEPPLPLLLVHWITEFVYCGLYTPLCLLFSVSIYCIPSLSLSIHFSLFYHEQLDLVLSWVLALKGSTESWWYKLTEMWGSFCSDFTFWKSVVQRPHLRFWKPCTDVKENDRILNTKRWRRSCVKGVCRMSGRVP